MRGRFSSSSAGGSTKVRMCSTVERKVYGLGGQPGTLITAVPGITSWVPTAPVGLGVADCTPPQAAHEPMAMTAAAPAAASRTSSTWVFPPTRSEEHTSELQSLMRISYAVFCLKKKKTKKQNKTTITNSTTNTNSPSTSMTPHQLIRHA